MSSETTQGTEEKWSLKTGDLLTQVGHLRDGCEIPSCNPVHLFYGENLTMMIVK